MFKNLAFITLLVLFVTTSCMKSKKNDTSNAPERPTESVILDGKLDDWKTKTNYLKGLTDPWGTKAKDQTEFDYKLSDKYFYFYFKTTDSTLTIPPFETERSVVYADRVELFFSKTEDLKQYYCFEVTPEEGILDYSAKHYREFDQDWDFKTLKVKAIIAGYNYTVEGQISRRELNELGLSGDIYLGIFRADYHNETDVNWYTKTIPDSATPDFHIPSALGKVNLNY